MRVGVEMGEGSVRTARSLGQSRGWKRESFSHHAFPPLIFCQWDGPSMKTPVLPIFAAWRDLESRRVWSCGKRGQPWGREGGTLRMGVSALDSVLRHYTKTGIEKNYAFYKCEISVFNKSAH